MENHLDFTGLADALLGRVRDLLPQWLPGGRLMGHEYQCSNLLGGQGSSLKVNVNNGKWADFAAGTGSGATGGDLISLYAAINGMKNGEAAKQLADLINYRLTEPRPAPPPAAPIEVTPPPPEAGPPVLTHSIYGPPTGSWCYRAADGSPIFYVARYDYEGKKQIVPWSWSPDRGRFIQKGQPTPRPLYGLELLNARPTAPVLIVEGEKACEAARTIAGNIYVVMTWPNGAKAVKSADWAPLAGRKLLIWPDADEPGRLAGEEISTFHVKQAIAGGPGMPVTGGPDIKLIDTTGQPYGWDAADALAEGWDWERFKAWAKPRAQVRPLPPPADTPPNAPADTSVPAKPTKKQPDPEEMAPISLFAAHEKLGLKLTKKKWPICDLDNVLRVFEGWPPFKDLIWFDEFFQKSFTKWKSPGGSTREWTDVDDLNLTAFLQRELAFMKLSDDIVRKAITTHAHRNVKNQPRDWLDSLIWDGQSRIALFFADALGATHSEYVRCASRNFWVSMVARVYRPGCKVDTMVILKGAQGAFKSTALAAIGGPWYAETHEDVTTNDFRMSLHGKMLVEISEMGSFKRAEWTSIKQAISCAIDTFRPPYGHRSQDFKRQTVLVGTTNSHQPLSDPTGGRRFHPIDVGKINIDLIRSTRDQLFAEAVSLFKSGATWWEMPEDETLAAQEDNREDDIWTDEIANWISSKTTEGVTVDSVGADCFGISLGKLDMQDARRIGGVLRLLGWAKNNRRTDGKQQKRWFPISKT